MREIPLGDNYGEVTIRVNRLALERSGGVR